MKGFPVERELEELADEAPPVEFDREGNPRGATPSLADWARAGRNVSYQSEDT